MHADFIGDTLENMQTLNNTKKSIKPVGYVYRFNSNQGGGSYCVVGHVNCSQCGNEIELREQLEPTKAQRKKGRYYAQSQWCGACGHWEGQLSSLTKV